ncbi:MAG: tRNA (adenosine(37)-N6)-threonylcarbamoyltransferase complex transferase subunit TsaD [Pseudomonadota bacterium]
MKKPLVLGLETSCDECAAAVVAGGPGAATIQSEVVRAQLDLHAAYGGVVPELAARAHVDVIDEVAAAALAKAGVSPGDLSAVGATVGPGLVGGLLVGASFGRAFAAAAGRPFVPVNHLEAHVLTPRLTEGTAYPYLVALLSGGHAQFLAVRDLGATQRLGTTIDDAAGEAFDKIAKLLGLGYPGGPAVERMAAQGDPSRFAFPIPLLKRPGADLSFAGLKTAVRLAAERAAPLSDATVCDIAAGFQATVIAHLRRQLGRALACFPADWGRPTAIVVVGGVAANQALRAALSDFCAENEVPMVAPPVRLCTDNGAMVAYAALERFCLGRGGEFTPQVRPRWPLDGSAGTVLGAGKRGAKV